MAITTDAVTDAPRAAQVQTYRDVIAGDPTHLEAKSAGPDGKLCDRQTVGFLQRRVVRSIPELTRCAGKEANNLEEVEAEIEHDLDEVWTEYVDPNRDPWMSLVVPVLKRMKAQELVTATGLAPSTVKAARNGHSKPHPKSQQALAHAAAAFARDQLQANDITPPIDDLTACAAFLECTHGIP